MKKLLLRHLGLALIALVCALLFTLAVPPAHAQQYTVNSLTLNSTTITNAVTDGNDSSAVTLTRFKDIGIQISFQGAGADTGNQTLLFKTSVDGTTYQTTGQISLTIPANGTTAVCVATNISLVGVGYIKLDSWQNAATNNVTNCVVKISTKPSAPFFKN